MRGLTLWYAHQRAMGNCLFYRVEMTQATTVGRFEAMQRKYERASRQRERFGESIYKRLFTLDQLAAFGGAISRKADFLDELERHNALLPEPYQAFGDWLATWRTVNPHDTRDAGELARTEYATWCKLQAMLKEVPSD